MDAMARFDANFVSAMPEVVSYLDCLHLDDVFNELVPRVSDHLEPDSILDPGRVTGLRFPAAAIQKHPLFGDN